MNDDGFLSNALFSQAVAALPLVSIDLCVTDETGKLLLGKRNNAPAKGWWFTPGARIRKNEPLAQALRRLLRDELALPDAFAARATLMGAWDHFYPDSAFDANTSTHYVNLPHALALASAELRAWNPPAGANAQHGEWCWMPLNQAARHERVHPYVQAYARWLEQSAVAK